jgi:hypothetical protein
MSSVCPFQMLIIHLLTRNRVNISQALGGPLYLMNQDWYNAWIAFTKQSFGLLITTMTQQWAPTLVRVSGDKSVRGQLLQTAEGNLVCDFPERMVLIANHQVCLGLPFLLTTADVRRFTLTGSISGGWHTPMGCMAVCLSSSRSP